MKHNICMLFLSILIFSSLGFAHNNRQASQNPYVVLLSPSNLNQVRVNIENYQPTSKDVKKYEINFGDGVKVTNSKDVIHQYLSNGNYNLVIKTWDNKNVVSTFTKTLDISTAYQVKDIAGSSVLGPVNVRDEKKYKINLTDSQAERLYKVTITKQSQSYNILSWLFNKKCKRDYNVEINGINIFNEDEVNCRTTQIEKFAWLKNVNEVRFEADEPRWKSSFKIEIHAVEIIKNLDNQVPVLSSNVNSNTLTNNNKVHISVVDASSVTTYIWNGQQQLLGTVTDKQFDLTLAEGINNFVLQSVDVNNNRSAYFYLSDITLDTVLPNIGTTLASEYIYSHYPQSFTLNLISDEDLQYLTVDNQPALMSLPRIFSYVVQIDSPQSKVFVIKAYDLAGNEKIQAFTVNFGIDNLAPIVSSNLAAGTVTRNDSFEISIVDNANVLTEIYKDDVLFLSSSEKNLNVRLAEGVNNFVVKSTDQYGNASQPFILSNIVKDTAPAQISSNLKQQYLFNSLPQEVLISFQTNEIVNSAKINSIEVLSGNSSDFSYNFSLSSAGISHFDVIVKDLAGNITQTSFSYVVKLDAVKPVINLSSTQNLTRNPEFMIQASVEDESETRTRIEINNNLIATINEKQFSYNLNLESGLNDVRLTSTDEAGNVSDVKSFQIVYDSVAPAITISKPSQNESIANVRLEVAGSANEELSQITVNGASLSLSSDKKSFSGNYVSSVGGDITLRIEATDLAGNTSSADVVVKLSDKLLVKELVSVVPDTNSNYYFVVGKAGAARSGSKVSVSAGMLSFNRGEDIARLNGEFSVKMSRFTTVTVKAEDLETGESSSFELNFNIPTSVAGIIKDTNDLPLAGVTVRILGSSASALSDASGVFSIGNAPIGDQTLSFDGSTVAQSTSGPQRRFSTHNLAVSITPGQVNAFDRPVYLSSSYLDGSGTTVSSNAGIIVTDSDAPSVSINIPANTAIFPDGSNTGYISIQKIPYSRTLIPLPSSVQPEEVFDFEPSGLKFTKPVDLTLPNVNELREGTEVFILGLNSQSGQWEIAGVGKVESGGSTIKTKPGQGILHFTAMTVMPHVPLFENVIDPSLEGVNVAKGAMETSINLPFYKSLGREVSPSLKYNSAWASPKAFVSHIFDIPKSEINYRSVTESSGTKTIAIPEICQRDIFGNKHCKRSAILDFYHREELLQNAGYYVDQLSAQSWVGINSTDNETFETIENSANSSDLPGMVLKNTIKTDKVTFVNNTEGTAIPNMSQMTFALKLQKEDGNYLKTGIYPSFTRFQAKLKQLVLTTKYIDQQLYVDGRHLEGPEYSFVRKKETNLETYYLDSILPTDMTQDLYIQNKVDSAFGRGWNFNVAEKIINTKGSKILIEEPNGDLSAYSLNYPIETLFNANGTDVLLEKGGSLGQWPKLISSEYGADRVGRAVEIDLLDQSKRTISTLETIAGSSGFDKMDECVQGGAGSRIRNYKFNFRHKPAISNVVTLPDGKVFATNSSTNSVVDITNTQSKTLGGYRQTSNFGFNTGGANHLQRYQNLCLSFDLDCDPLVDLGTSQSCSSSLGIHSESGQFAKGVTEVPLTGPGSDDFSQGLINGSGSFGTANYTNVKFNNPTGLVISPNGKLIVADTGSNVVYEINPISGNMKILAGDYQAIDRGDGTYAAPQVTFDVVKAQDFKQLLWDNVIPKAYALPSSPIYNFSTSSLYHPKGLVYDTEGNLYITTENGYVRRVAIDGKISTYAGRRVDDGGALANDMHAELIVLSNPTGIIIDSDRNIMYVADTGNHRVVQIDMNTKIANTIAGNGNCDLDVGDGGSALNASLCAPTWLSFDNAKNLVILDSGHKRVRRVKLNNLAEGKLSYLPYKKDNSKIEKLADGSFVRTFRNGSKSIFNNNGQQTSATDRVGRSVNYTYDQNTGNVLTVTDSVGQVSELQYSNDKLVSFRDPANRVTSFVYDSFNSAMLSKVIFPDGSKKEYIYDAEGRMLEEKNQNSKSKKFYYDGVGRLTRIKDENNFEINLKDLQSQTLNSPKKEGLAPDKVSTDVDLPNESEISLTKDANGFIRKLKDALGNVTEFEMDAQGRVLAVKRGADQSISMKYSAAGDLIETKNEITGLKKTSTYNSFGQMISSTDFNAYTSNNVYANETGLLLSVTEPNSVLTDYVYNLNGQVIRKTVYPQAGNISNSLSFKTEYDVKGNIKKSISPNNQVQEYEYDAAGNVIASSVFKDQVKVTTQYVYNLNNNRLIKVISPNNEVTEYEYDDVGNLLQIKDPKGQITAFEYDSKNQLVKRTSPEGYVKLLEYDSMGNVSKETDANGSVKTFTYFKDNNVKMITMPDEVFEYTYDTKGQVATIASSNSSRISYIRDLNNRLIMETVTGAQSVTNTMTYDNNGNRTSMYSLASGYYALVSIPDNETYLQKMNYSYDANNRLASLTNMWGDQFGFNYDAANRLVSVTRPGSNTSYSYDANSNLIELSHNVGSTVKGYTQLAYDSRNFITQKRHPASTNNYVYDNNGQLSAADMQEDPSKNEIFVYDELGNRTAYNGQQSIYSQQSQRILDDGTFLYTYDNNGNVRTKFAKNQGTSYSFVYNSRNQLINSYVLSAPLAAPLKTISYKYDPTGRRIEKSVVDHQNSSKNYFKRFVYDGPNIIAEIDINNRLLASYTHSPLSADDLLAAHFTSHAVSSSSGGDAISSEYVLSNVVGNTYYLKDHLNTITDIINASGAIIQSYDYSAYGKFRGIKDVNGQSYNFDNAPIRSVFSYTSREYEKETDIYYYRARYYDANIGRFLQQDPEPGKLGVPSTFLSKYVYVDNRPTMLTDSTGRDFFSDLFFTVTSGILFNIGLAVTLLDPAMGLSMILMGVQYSLIGQVLNLMMMGDLPHTRWFRGVPVVVNSFMPNLPFLGRAGRAFSMGAAAFLPGRTSKFRTPASQEGESESFEEEMKHEFGHTLQYRAMGGWGYISAALNGGFGGAGDFEKDADCRASKYFGEFIDNYGGGCY